MNYTYCKVTQLECIYKNRQTRKKLRKFAL